MHKNVGKCVTVHPNSINHDEILLLIAIYHSCTVISSLSFHEAANKQHKFSDWSKFIFLEDKQRSTEDRSIFLNDNKTLFLLH